MLTDLFLCGRRRGELSDVEKRALEGAATEVRAIPARTRIVERGERLRASTLLLEGWMCRYVDSRDGQRQIVALQVPGDFVDLHGFPLERLDHDVGTLSACRVATVPHDRLFRIVVEFPHLARLLWFSTLLDAAMHREWIFRIGRLSALGRVAHLLCELHERLRVVGLVKDGSFDFPLTQQDIGEACGLTSVHANRTIGRLRNDGLVTIAHRRVTIHDFAGLARVAEFEGGYLYLDDGSQGD
ncbi:Crp/Fnr family transcriptional regulator [Sphingomonas donggukensis]|uniref:Crp/Fnr family transcriptional regulator n=1 Tax=Sphingomonas donggukensis TaxID=2949093 RepID=A0ABY4TVW2_9SPHN|nr:Crp/Fnr family transcriptional regulator [Sphingomonas donggukensis]URW76545.1 Crp/Fnr family transcriptional regulator [Sphingomonas donggukensis]